MKHRLSYRKKKKVLLSLKFFRIILIIVAAVILLILTLNLTLNHAADEMEKERKANGKNNWQNNGGLSLKSFSTDKEIYHSAETMNMRFEIYSSDYSSNATIGIRGINGKLNIKDSVFLKKGLNTISFEYQLPRCNVCGGISEGNYSIEYEIFCDNSEIKGLKIVEIKQ